MDETTFIDQPAAFSKVLPEGKIQYGLTKGAMMVNNCLLDGCILCVGFRFDVDIPIDILHGKLVT